MHFMMSFTIPTDRRLSWLKITLPVAAGLGFVLSWQLWISSRLFPLVPVVAKLPAVPFPLDYIWFALVLGLLAAICFRAEPRKIIVAFLVLAGLLCLFDQMRWQPWFYQYFFMLAALGFYAWKEPGVKNNRVALNCCALIIVCIYFWSGVQKLNASFINEVWPGMLEPLRRFMPGGLKSLPPFTALIIPLLEICIALGLLTRRFRNASVILAIATHAVILALLISAGENTVVWPWNIAMGFMVLILFWQNKESTVAKILVPKRAFHALVLLLFGVLPSLGLIGLWDSYLSSALYSGNNYRGVIYITQPVMDRLPIALRQYVWTDVQPMFLDTTLWAYGELNVPVYPEPRVFRSLTEQVCKYADRPSDVQLGLREKPNLFTGVRETRYYDCNHLR
jgi:hypothetical protein